MKFQLPVVFAGLCLLTSLLRAQAPAVASLSASQTVTEGQNITLSVSVNGTSPFTYQWRKAGSAISGATQSSLAFTPIRAADAGTYTVVIVNSAGSTTSGPVVLAVNPAVAPTFYYQPSAQTVTAGNTLSLSASVSGTDPLTFVWKRGTTTVGTTSSGYFSIANAQAGDAGSYTVTVSNVAGSVTSNAFTVTVNQPTAPTFSSNLSDVTVATGDSIWIYSSVNSSTTVTYQWKKDGTSITGATNYYYYKSNAQASDAGNYSVTATNSVGSVTSNAAKLTVQAPVAPTISSVSGPVSVVVGDSFSLSVYASGTGPFTYQWRKDGQPITGATSNYFSKSGVQVSDAGSYTVVVSNAQGSVTSNAVPVAISNAQPPIITYHPPSQALRQGEYIYSMSVGVSGTGPLTYQWKKDGVNISGGTGSSLYFGHVATPADAGTYSVVVSSAQGTATSEPIYISVLPATAPTISQQPYTQTVRQGQAISLYANISGTPAPTVQWRKDGAPIAGGTSTNYYKSNAASSDAGAYTFVATNSAGSVTSEVATITVVAPGAPQILSHPASASLLPGDSFYGMYVEVRSSTNVTVQWYRDGQIVPNATSSYFNVYNAQPSIAGTYTAVVTNSVGSVTSREAVLTVDANTTRPVITYVQGSRRVQGGNSVYINIATSSSGESVQWFKDGLIIPNATGKEYSFNNFGLGSVGTYTAQVTNASGTFTSRPIVLELLDSGLAPVITVQPAGQMPFPGQGASFSVTAEGEMPMTFQWRKDGVNIAGATSSYYSPAVSASAVGSYSAVVTNRNGSATSTAAALSLAPTASVAPIILYHPASQTLTTGSSYLNLSVSLLDSTGATYQWRKNGTAISGATSSSYYLYSISTATAGRYSVVVTNAAGSTTSYDAVIGVTNSTTGPVFSQQPQSQTAYLGGSVTFTASATSSATVSYQWSKNGAAITGATSTSLTLSNLQASDAATYTLLATDANGATPSNGATLTVTGGVPPFIVSSPNNITVMAGGTATFNGSAGGTPAPTIQWQKNGIDLPGATQSSLVLTNVQADHAGNYAFVARSPVGNATSSAAALTVVYPPPVITTQPVAISAQPGGTAVFSVVASNLPPPTFQWRKDGVDIAGATSSVLTLNNVQSSAGGRYSVVVKTNFGSVTSVEALLTVGTPITVTPPTNVTATVGGTATLSATVQSTDPLVFRWARNGSFIAGVTGTTLTFANVQLADAGIYVLVITRPDGTVLYPLSGSGALVATLTVTLPPRPVFVLQPADQTVAIGAPLTLTARAQGTGPISYQWRKDGQPLPGATGETWALPVVQVSDQGGYSVVATDSNGATESSVARVTVLGSPFAGTYAGTLASGDSWSMHVGADGRGVFLALLAGRGQAIVARNLVVQPGGAFAFGQAAPTAASGAAATASRYFDGLVQGQIAGGGVTGVMADGGVALSGARVTGSATLGNVGHVQAVTLGGGLGQLDAIAGPDGSVFLVAVDETGVRGGRGTMTASGSFSVIQSDYAFAGTLAAGAGRLAGTYTPAGGSPASFDTAATAAGAERLINVATRGLTNGSSSPLTAGFVISGSSAKEVLIRAVGPGLGSFGVTGVLPNPRLRIFRDGTPVIENDDWTLSGLGTQIAEAAVRVGAFSLTPGSADAAILARLDPGAYTAQVGTTGESRGVVLVEVYDTVSPAAGAPKLVNLSTRGDVGRDGDVLIAGIVVSGTAPKRLLIRGIGPTLRAFGVEGALEDSKLKLFQGTTLLRENDNWSESADAAALATTSRNVGAFELAANSKDAVLLLYLAPGSYTAQVSGVNNTTGVALVEVYEVP